MELWKKNLNKSKKQNKKLKKQTNKILTLIHNYGSKQMIYPYQIIKSISKNKQTKYPRIFILNFLATSLWSYSCYSHVQYENYSYFPLPHKRKRCLETQ